MIQVLFAKDMARIFGYASPRSFLNEFGRRPEKFPPAVRLPGFRAPYRWFEADVLDWMQAHRPR